MALAVKHFTLVAQGAGQSDTGVKELASISVQEVAAGAAALTLREGAAGGTQRVFIKLASGESQFITVDHPLVASTGTGTWFVDVDSGTVDITVSGRV